MPVLRGGSSGGILGGPGTQQRTFVPAPRAVWPSPARRLGQPNPNQLDFTQLLDDGDTLFAPAIGLNLAPNLFSDGDTLFAPAIGLNLAPNLFSDGDTLFAPAVGLNLKPTLYSDGDTLFAPAIGLNLAPNLFSDGDTLFAPAVGLNLKPTLYSDGDTLFAPTVAFGGGAAATQPLKKPVAIPRIVKTPNVLDLYRNRRYRVEARFPGGRTIVKAKAATRERAFEEARRAFAPQSSPTAGGGAVNYSETYESGGPTGGGGGDRAWERNLWDAAQVP
jgi:hypothetical protein